jgi:hypothetical protein
MLKTCEGSQMPLIYIIQQESNAGDNPPRANSIQFTPPAQMMKAIQSRVGFIDLLDSVRHSHSEVPNLLPSILAFNAPNAAWRFISLKIQCSMLARAQSLQTESARKRELCFSRLVKAQTCL